MIYRIAVAMNETELINILSNVLNTEMEMNSTDNTHVFATFKYNGNLCSFNNFYVIKE